MKKILGFLSLLMLITSGVGSVVSCEMVTNGQNHQKVPITNENLRIFFAENKIFEYQDEFFFKDELEQTKEETDKMAFGVVAHLYEFLLDQTFGEKFRNYFSYLPFEYQFKALKLQAYSGYRLRQTYDITFNVLIKSNKNKIDFKQNDLVLKFTETSQYPEQKGLVQYVDYFINLSNEIGIKKYDGFNSRLLLNPLAAGNEDFSKIKYLEKNNATILQDISDYYTKIFSADESLVEGFYPEKKMIVIANSYEYLGIVPEFYYHEGFRAKVNLTLLIGIIHKCQGQEMLNYEWNIFMSGMARVFWTNFM